MIRKATHKDLSALSALAQHCFPHPWSQAVLEQALATNLFLLFETEGQIVGYGILLPLFGEGEILQLAVHPAFRRQHIGTALLQALTEQAEQKQMTRLFLEVRRSNLAAQKLYQSFGFRLIGQRKQYYSDPPEDALLMQRGGLE